MNREQVTTQLAITAITVAFVMWARRSGRAELERSLARVDQWIDDRRFLDAVSRGEEPPQP